MTKLQKPKRMCNHPEWYSYGELVPEPAEIVYQCECGENWACPVCNWGVGIMPCSCTRARRDKIEQSLEQSLVENAGVWEAPA